MRIMWIIIGTLVVTSLSCQGQAPPPRAATGPPKTQISSAKVQGSALTIAATYFAPNSTATLNGTSLKLGPVKPTEMTAVLADSLAPGSYLLFVTGGTPATTDSFTVTIGSTGPPGPPGPSGPPGPAGPPGTSAPLPSGFSILGDTPTPPKGFAYTGNYIVSQGGAIGWTLRSPMPTPRVSAAVGVVKGTLYVIGGAKDDTLAGLSTVEAYDPATNAWTPKAPMPSRRYAAGVGVINGIIYVVGGAEKNDMFTGTFEAYDPATDQWTAKAPIPAPRKGVVTAVVNNILYVMGDFASFATSSVNSAPGVEAYDPATDTWTQKAQMPTSRSNFMLSVLNNMIYAVGGMTDTLQATTEAYDPATNTWTPKAPMPGPRTGFAPGVINGILYVAGGVNERGLAGPTYAYDPMFDTWSTSLTIPILTGSPAGAATDEGVFFLFGGSSSGGKILPAVQAFVPSGPRYYIHKVP